MTGHILTKKAPEKKSLAQPFFSWLNSHASLFTGHLITIISFGGLITALIFHSLETGHWLTGILNPLLLQHIIFGVHIAFIIFCIVYLLVIIDVNDIEKDRVKETREMIFPGNVGRYPMTLKRSQSLLREFKFYFLLFWISMFALYLAFMFIAVKKQKGPTAESVATLSSNSNVQGDVSHNAETVKEEDKNVLVNVSGYKMNVARVQTGNDPGNVESEKATDATEAKPSIATYVPLKPFQTSDWGDAFKHIFPEFLPFALNTVSLMFVFWCLSILYIPYQRKKEKLRQRRLLYFSSFVVFLLVISYPALFDAARRDDMFTESSLLGYATVFDAISGTLNAVVLALLIARLDSKLIGLPSWLVSVLYLYAAVQPLFVVFAQPGLVNVIIKTVVLLFVFILKVYFFLIIVYALQTGRMLNYLFCFPTLNQRVRSMFENRFEITIQEEHEGRFNFSITKNRDVIYKAKDRFHSKEACIGAIEQLRAFAARRDSYYIDRAGGAVTIDIVEKKGQLDTLYCSSVDLKSNSDAEVLITESMDYLPYCRLNKSQ